MGVLVTECSGVQAALRRGHQRLPLNLKGKLHVRPSPPHAHPAEWTVSSELYDTPAYHTISSGSQIRRDYNKEMSVKQSHG